MKIHKWRDIRRMRFTDEQLAELDAWVADEALQINLAKIRELVGVTQEDLAAKLDMTQGALSRAERSSDPKLSTLRRHVEALGGEIEVRAVFGDKSVKLGI
jgi:DNA-binding XRE family transcriptional regulator